MAPNPVRLLQERGVAVDSSPRRLAEYSYDASNYRVRPLGVVFPRTAHEVAAAVGTCRDLGVPVVVRGGGTSMAGNAIGPGVVLDLSRHFSGIREINVEARTVDVDPGVVLAQLSTEVERRTGGQFTFAPDPSSRARATVGGAIGNDACGNHSVRHGRTSDHVVELDVLTSDGALLTAFHGGVRATSPDDAHSVARAAHLTTQLTALAHAHLGAIRTELGRIPRQVSGYHLQHLLPERGFDVARALVGTEGSCAIVLAARLRIVPTVAHSVLLCLGYDDVVDAARDVPELLPAQPSAIEGIDEQIVATMRWRRGADSVSRLPRGRAWLFVELDGEDAAALAARAAQLVADLREHARLVDGFVVTDPVARQSLWRVREDGAGLSSRLAPLPGEPTPAQAWPGWEDSAVAPHRLADYLADLRLLLKQHGLTGVMYGHFGAGCMHIRITYDLRSEAGRKVFREFSIDAAKLVVRHGGTLSGEHGDGRARSQLLPLMYSPEMLSAFVAYQRIWDPDGVLSIASLAAPAPFTDDLALADVPAREWPTALTFEASPGGVDPFVDAAQRCIGVARCRTTSGGVMCPSYRATRDEKDSTRGRARVLQEVLRTAPDVRSGWAASDVVEALDLCLSCKACSTDCPTGVDMATLKSEFLYQHYRERARPRSHYALGWLPLWLRLASRVPRIAQWATASPGAARLMPSALRALGLTTERELPALAGRLTWIRQVAAAGATRPGSGTGEVLLFVDTFTRAFRPEVAGSVAAVIGSAGQRVECTETACCALPLISTGQLDVARTVLKRAVKTLDDGTDRPVVVPEPSCAAALRHDLPRLIPTRTAQRLAHRVRSFADYAAELSAQGRLDTAVGGAAVGGAVVLQQHCHENAVFGPSSQTTVLAAAGVRVVPASGCCGVAGTFGFEADHYDVSVAVAEHALAPALRSTLDDVPVLTDGFSCAMAVQHLAPGRGSMHLAQLLDPRRA